MKRKVAGLFLCFLSIVLLFSSSAAAKEKVDIVKVYIKPAMGQSPVMIAVEEGYFKEQGIDIEFVQANRSSETWLLMIGGSVDVMISAPASGLYNAAALEKNIKLVAGANYLVANNKSETFGIRRGPGKKAGAGRLIRGLKGKKVGIPQLGSITHYLVDQLLEDNGLSVEDVELVIVPHHSMAQSLQSGILDAGLLAEPFGSVLRKKHGGEVLFVNLGDAFPDTPYIFLMYGEKLLVKDPELGVRFMKAFLKGYERYKEGKTQRNIQIIAKHTGLDEETVRTINWPEIDPRAIFKSSGVLGAYQDWLLKNNFIEKAVPVELLMDTSFLEKAGRN